MNADERRWTEICWIRIVQLFLGHHTRSSARPLRHRSRPARVAETNYHADRHGKRRARKSRGAEKDPLTGDCGARFSLPPGRRAAPAYLHENSDLPMMAFFLSISNVSVHFWYFAGTSSVVTAVVPR